MHKRSIKKAAAVVMAFLTAFSPVATALPTYASGKDGDDGLYEKGQDEVAIVGEAEKSVDTAEAAKGSVAFLLKNKGGALTVQVGDDGEVKAYAVDGDGNVKVSDAEGNVADVALTGDGYFLVVEADEGTVIHTVATSAEGYNVATYAVSTDSGTEKEITELAGSVSYDITVQGNKVVTAGFEAEKSEQSEKTEKTEKTESKPAASTAAEVEEEEAFHFGEAGKSLIRRICEIYGYDSEYTIKRLEEAHDEITAQEISGEYLCGVDTSTSVQANLTESYKIEYGADGYGTLYRGVNGLSGNATCIMPSISSAGGGTYTAYPIVDAGLRRLMYYAPGAYGYQNSYDAQVAYFGFGSDDARYAYWHLALSYLYAVMVGNQYGYWSNEWTQSLSDEQMGWIQTLTDTILGLPDAPDGFKCYIFTTGSGTQPMAYYENYEAHGYVYVQKKSSNPELTDNNPDYDLTGTTINLYNSKEDAEADRNAVYSLGVAGPDGKSGVLQVKPGNYFFKEVKVGKGFTLNPTVGSISITANHTQSNPAVIEITNTPDTGGLSLIKSSAVPEITKGNPCYDLAGATYEIYKSAADANAGTNSVGKLVCKSDGTTNTINDLAPGTYYYKETVAGKNYALKTFNAATDKITVETGKSAVINTTDVPLSDPAGIVINKIDATTGEPVETDASAAGAQFTIKYYAVEGDYKTVAELEQASGGATRTWVIETQAVTIGGQTRAIANLQSKYLVSGSDELYQYNGKETIPAGYITIEETKAPSGYSLEEKTIRNEKGEITDGVVVTKVAGRGSVAQTVAGNTFDAIDYPVRGDVEFVKTDDKGKTLANVVFKLSRLDGNGRAVEDHFVMTDAEGKFSTAASYAKHSENTNAGTAGAGTWFGSGDPDDSMGALPAGQYKLQEMRTSANKGYKMESFTFSITKNEQVVSLKSESAETIVNHPVSIGTTATNAATGDHMAEAKGTVTIHDKVSYKNLEVGATYRIDGTLMDKATGEALVINGKPVTATSGEFEVKESNGSVVVDFTVDAKGLEGKDVVAFEKLYLIKSSLNKDGIDDAIATHEKINDESQTIHFVGIGTKAEDNTTKTQVTKADTKIVINDTVEYKNILAGKTYTVEGTLVNKKDGKPITDKDGNAVKASATIEAKAEEGQKTVSGKVVVQFNFELTEEQAQALAGKSLVAFETLKQGDTEIAVHADLNDKDQTIYVPKVETEAKDEKTETHNAFAEKEVTIVDTVTYTNVIPGKEYTVSGVLMDKATGKELLVNGKTVTATAEPFTAEKANGTVELRFTFDGTGLEGKTIVAFETMKHEGIEVAVHADIEDENQTVWIPEIKTEATDANSGTHTALAGEKITIKDVVSYKNFIPGTEYVIEGVLMDKETGKEFTVGGKPVTAKTDPFKPEKSEGTVELTFTFDGSALDGSTLVAFETATVATKTVAEHKDINDEKQTVYIPHIETKATDAQTKDQVVTAKKDIVINDIVEYENLIPGKEYTITGTLHNKADGSVVTDKDGKEVTAESEPFKAPESGKGTQTVTFKFSLTDAQLKKLGGKSMVAFETLKEGDVEVAVHADINDKDQTVYVPKVETEAKDKETETQNAYADKTITIVDKVTYTNLVPGKEYKVTGVLMDKATGKELLVNGKKVTAESDTFKADKANGSIDLEFTFDGTGLEGKTIVVFETLRHENIEVAVHADINDKDQTVWIPKIGTKAADAEISIQNQEAAEGQTVTDTVSYENLLPDTWYTLKGVLMDKETNKEIPGAVATATFKTPAADTDVVSGEAVMEITYDATGLANHALVVFEDLYLTPEEYRTESKDVPVEALEEKSEVASHKDIEDDGQTIYIPEIRTHAKDLTSGTKTALAEERVVIEDLVTYENLLPNKEYTMEGTLVEKTTAKEIPLLADEAVESEDKTAEEKTDSQTEASDAETGTESKTEDTDVKETTGTDKAEESEGTSVTTTTKKTVTFTTPDLTDEEKAAGKKTVSGSVTLTFTIDGSALGGKTVVAFEKLYYMNKELAVHADINDEDQSVNVPEIGTKLVDKADKDKLVLGNEKAVLVDIVAFKNLVAGRKYIAKATLMDKETGKAVMVKDKPVTVEVPFTPQTSDGTVNVEIPLDATALQGHTLVAFEKVFDAEAKKEIAKHEDIKDEEQTVYVPKIATVLKNKADGSKSITASGTITLVDTVAYSNLIPGQEYIAKATLMDKATGKALTVNGKAVTGEAKFKADKATGTADVEITFNASNLGNKTLVAFEKLYTADGKVEMAVHEDINDKDQTVTLTPPPSNPPTTPPRTQTGDTPAMYIMLGAAVVLLICATLLFKRKKHTR